MNKTLALAYYKKIQEKQGEHNGRWRDELDQEDSSNDYYTFMLETYESIKEGGVDINIEINLEQHREDENDREYILMDREGFRIKQILEKYLETIILE